MILRKKDIAEFYKNRNEITNESAEELFCSTNVLSLTDEKFNDGVKLSAYLLLEKLGVKKAWKLLQNIIVSTIPQTHICHHIGTVLRRSYRDALRESNSEDVVCRADVATHIFKPLLEHCIMSKRKYAEKFCAILRGATVDRDDAMSSMLFDISTPIVWRYLNAKNAGMRLSAYFVQTNVFPPSTDDPIVQTNYFNKHCDAFISALKDPVIDICLQAIENVCEVTSLYFDQISSLHIDNIFDELSVLAEDESVEIRAAVFRGLRHFHECAVGVVKFKMLLKKICKKAIDDSSDRVRCNFFRLLNTISDSKINVVGLSVDPNETLLSIEDVLYRFDFEQNEEVEREIGCLLFLNIFEKEMSNEDRYKALNQLCCINRNACLDFHRLIYSYEIADTTHILSHISSASIVCLRMLQTLDVKQADLNDKRMDKYDFEKYIANGDTDNSSFDENNETKTAHSYEKLSRRIKNVIDCMVVCYSTMVYDPAFKSDKFSETHNVSRYLIEIASVIISRFESNDDLLDTALSIVALVKNAGIHSSSIRNTCTKMLRSGHLNARYLEIFGLIAMDKLLELLQSGLEQLEKLSSNTENGLKRKRPSQSNEFVNKKIAIDALMMLLNLPSCSQYIVEKHLHYVTSFIDTLNNICDNFMANLKKGRSVDTNLLITCWKVWTVLLIIRYNKDAFADEEEENDEKSNFKRREKAAIVSQKKRLNRSSIILSQLDSQLCPDPLMEECDWFERHLQSQPKLIANIEVIEYFYEAVGLHFQAYKHSKQTVKSVIEYLKKVYKLGQQHTNKRKSINDLYTSCLKAGKHALEFAEPNADNNHHDIFEEEDDDID